jgi:photosystem II stability/assembly factor-like uncharacterized protein
MRRHGWWLAVVLAACGAAHAQWVMESSGTTADLRGIDNVGGGVAWASGTNGTVLRTEDGGYLWQACAVPPGAEHLDLRGVQAFDANTAIVMSSGKGDLSRLYKTTDGCQTWKLVFTNPDKEGFWDAVRTDPDTGAVSVLGDPVAGAFRLFTQDPGTHEFSAKLHADNLPIWHGNPLRAAVGEAAFAASNSTLILKGKLVALAFVTGGNKSEFIEYIPDIMANHTMYSDWNRAPLPFAAGESSGAFSAVVCSCERDWRYFPIVVVGGDYQQPDATSGNAAVSYDAGLHFERPDTPPHGYRSAVAYDAATKAWITVGPNGTDISTDDGRNWRALHPDPAMHEAADADRDWNALSLPFVVGPHGRIGKLNAKALEH